MTDYLNLKLEPGDVKAISVLGLAHIGDAVYELMIRSYLCSHGAFTAKKLHKAAVSYVAAKSQAEAAARLIPQLTEQEEAVYRRGRNCRVNTIPRGATIEEYHAATGLEALFGFLYLSGDTKRLNELFNTAIAQEGSE